MVCAMCSQTGGFPRHVRLKKPHAQTTQLLVTVGHVLALAFDMSRLSYPSLLPPSTILVRLWSLSCVGNPLGIALLAILKRQTYRLVWVTY